MKSPALMGLWTAAISVTMQCIAEIASDAQAARDGIYSIWLTLSAVLSSGLLLQATDKKIACTGQQLTTLAASP